MCDINDGLFIGIEWLIDWLICCGLEEENIRGITAVINHSVY